jgi:hypothetical protein
MSKKSQPGPAYSMIDHCDDRDTFIMFIQEAGDVHCGREADMKGSSHAPGVWDTFLSPLLKM